MTILERFIIAVVFGAIGGVIGAYLQYYIGKMIDKFNNRKQS